MFIGLMSEPYASVLCSSQCRKFCVCGVCTVPLSIIASLTRPIWAGFFMARTRALPHQPPYNSGVSSSKGSLVVHRVVVKRLDHRGNWIVEAGPWHASRSNAENWAEILRYMGYSAQVESIHGNIPGGSDDDDLRKALSGMA